MILNRLMKAQKKKLSEKKRVYCLILLTFHRPSSTIDLNTLMILRWQRSFLDLLIIAPTRLLIFEIYSIISLFLTLLATLELQIEFKLFNEVIFLNF